MREENGSHILSPEPLSALFTPPDRSLSVTFPLWCIRKMRSVERPVAQLQRLARLADIFGWKKRVSEDQGEGEDEGYEKEEEEEDDGSVMLELEAEHLQLILFFSPSIDTVISKLFVPTVSGSPIFEYEIFGFREFLNFAGEHEVEERGEKSGGREDKRVVIEAKGRVSEIEKDFTSWWKSGIKKRRATLRLPCEVRTRTGSKAREKEKEIEKEKEGEKNGFAAGVLEIPVEGFVKYLGEMEETEGKGKTSEGKTIHFNKDSSYRLCLNEGNSTRKLEVVSMLVIRPSDFSKVRKQSEAIIGTDERERRSAHSSNQVEVWVAASNGSLFIFSNSPVLDNSSTDQLKKEESPFRLVKKITYGTCTMVPWTGPGRGSKGLKGVGKILGLFLLTDTPGESTTNIRGPKPPFYVVLVGDGGCLVLFDVLKKEEVHREYFVPVPNPRAPRLSNSDALLEEDRPFGVVPLLSCCIHRPEAKQIWIGSEKKSIGVWSYQDTGAGPQGFLSFVCSIFVEHRVASLIDLPFCCDEDFLLADILDWSEDEIEEEDDEFDEEFDEEEKDAGDEFEGEDGEESEAEGLVVCGGEGGELSLLSAKNPEPLTLKTPFHRPVCVQIGVAVEPTKELWVAGGESCYVLDMFTNTVKTVLSGHSGNILHMSLLSEDSSRHRVRTSSRNRKMKEGMKKKKGEAEKRNPEVWMMTSSWDSSVCLWDCRAKTHLMRIEGVHESSVAQLCFFPFSLGTGENFLVHSEGELLCSFWSGGLDGFIHSWTVHVPLPSSLPAISLPYPTTIHNPNPAIQQLDPNKKRNLSRVSPLPEQIAVATIQEIVASRQRARTLWETSKDDFEEMNPFSSFPSPSSSSSSPSSPSSSTSSTSSSSTPVLSRQDSHYLSHLEKVWKSMIPVVWRTYFPSPHHLSTSIVMKSPLLFRTLWDHQMAHCFSGTPSLPFLSTSFSALLSSPLSGGVTSPIPTSTSSPASFPPSHSSSSLPISQAPAPVPPSPLSSSSFSTSPPSPLPSSPHHFFSFPFLFLLPFPLRLLRLLPLLLLLLRLLLLRLLLLRLLLRLLRLLLRLLRLRLHLPHPRPRPRPLPRPPHRPLCPPLFPRTPRNHIGSSIMSSGLPFADILRPSVWALWSGALYLQQQYPHNYYHTLTKKQGGMEADERQIEKRH